MVELPLHVAWSGRRVYDVGREDQRLVLYALLLAEAPREELERFVHRESLISLWPRLRRHPDLVARDVMQLSDIERTAQMRALIRLLAARSGQLLVASSVGNQAGVSQATALRYIGLLEEVFPIKRVPAWSATTTT